MARQGSRIALALVLGLTAGGLAAAPGFAAANQPAAGAAAPMAAAGDRQAPATGEDRGPGELAREGVAKMLQAFDRLIESVPQYALPEINENGDIIIRRKAPERPAEPRLQPSPSPENREI